MRQGTSMTFAAFGFPWAIKNRRPKSCALADRKSHSRLNEKCFLVQVANLSGKAA